MRAVPPAIVVALLLSTTGCDDGCPDGTIKVCDAEGVVCECSQECTAHSQCESGKYCADDFRACVWVQQGQAALSPVPCGPLGGICCVITNAFGAAHACFAGAACNASGYCAAPGGTAGGGGPCAGIDQPCQDRADCCPSVDGYGYCGLLNGVAACRDPCTVASDCASGCCYPVPGEVSLCGPCQ
jgi:hypothetical protein